ncbi:MAG: hypothetical protein HYZ26_02825 [Chloroflexi bacterium]|nr:hypothetical protein [Chloroflexota bacterium]
MLEKAKGIDVSYHRGEVDWSAVRHSGVSFAFVKATEGVGFIDPQFVSNWVKMRSAGLIRGAYHFYRPDIDALAQARHFLQRIQPFLHEFDMPPVLDVENSPAFVREAFQGMSPAQRIGGIRAWLEEVLRNTGRTPIIYTNPDTWRTSLGDTATLTRHPLWIANYGVAAPIVPAGGWAGSGWTFWQFTDRGAVPGVNQGRPPVDMNYYQGTEQQLLGWLGIAGLPHTVPELSNAEMLAAIGAATKKHGANLVLLLDSLRLGYLQDAAYAPLPYDGLAPLDLDIPEPILDSLMTQVDLILADRAGTVSTYPLYALTNQQVINGFYEAAETLGQGGWALLHSAGLAHLANDRQARYRGPRLETIESLSGAQMDALSKVFGIVFAQVPPDDQSPVPYSGITNQMMINAIYRLAGLLGLPGWTMVERLGLAELVNDRTAEYRGPLLMELRNISDSDRSALAGYLNIEYGPTTQEGPYPGLLNQEMINVFYRAAQMLNASGWGLLAQAGLAHLAASPEIRNALYAGPAVNDLPGLDSTEKAMILRVLTG